MKKRDAAVSASLKGKKPGNTAQVKKAVSRNPSFVKNKLKRSELYGKYLSEKKVQKKVKRLERAKEAEALGTDVAENKPKPKTLDNTREVEPTRVQADDDEIALDEAGDEFAAYFSDDVRPKILLTTRPRPSRELFFFIADLQRFFPALFFYPRRSYSMKQIVEYGTNKEFTHLMVLSEKSKVCNGMIVSHLRKTDAGPSAGPTAFFKVTNVIPSPDIKNHGSATSHVPELVLNGFTTRLGHRAGRFLGSLFPHNAQFRGRQVATFHNQRDYIFVRHHRYVFEAGKEKAAAVAAATAAAEAAKEDGDKSPKKPPPPKTKARLQELGPRFTLKLRWIQEGTFDSQFGEYEWFHKRKEMDTTRRKFHL